MCSLLVRIDGRVWVWVAVRRALRVRTARRWRASPRRPRGVRGDRVDERLPDVLASARRACSRLPVIRRARACPPSCLRMPAVLASAWRPPCSCLPGVCPSYSHLSAVIAPVCHHRRPPPVVMLAACHPAPVLLDGAQAIGKVDVLASMVHAAGAGAGHTVGMNTRS
jgi:hypothetical protein